jgi:hypothetical protein
MGGWARFEGRGERARFAYASVKQAAQDGRALAAGGRLACVPFPARGAEPHSIQASRELSALRRSHYGLARGIVTRRAETLAARKAQRVEPGPQDAPEPAP